MRYTTKLIQQIGIDYAAGVPVEEICENYGLSNKSTLYWVMHRNGIKRHVRAGRTSYRLYMLVSDDVTELPLTAPAETVKELSEIADKKLDTLYAALTRGNIVFFYPNGKKKPPVRAKVVKINLEE